MKSLLCLMALLAAPVFLTGCETVADTASENAVRIGHAQALNMQQIPEDVERVLMIDRPVWLSRYPIPND